MMAKRNDGAFPVSGLFFDILSIPYNFFSGFLAGIVAPVATIAAIVAGIRLVTGKVPFISLAESDEAGERHLRLTLVPEDEVGERFEVEKGKVSGDIEKLSAEVKAIIEKSKAQQAASEGPAA